MLAVFLSGKGSNFEAIYQACEKGLIKHPITLVISDNKEARGLKTAQDLGIEAVHISYDNGKVSAENEINSILKSKNIKKIALAGYMRILSSDFVSAWRGDIVNVHPSLLPAFKGAHAIEDAFNYGVKVTGVTVHIVDEGVDTGKILAQKPVIIAPDDTLASLEEKIHATEHSLYPKTLSNWLIA